MDEKTVIMGSVILTAFVGTVAVVLFKMGVNRNTVDFTQLESVIRFIFDPYIFTSLVLMFLGRLIHQIPLSRIDIGQFTILLTPLTVIFTLIAGVIFFQESFTFRQFIGIILGVISICLIL